MAKTDEFLDNTRGVMGCWGYNPEPEKHDAFIGWRTIFTCVNGKPELDYVPGRGSCRGLKSDCDRLVRWWAKRNKWWAREVPEKWWLKTCAPCRKTDPGPHVICGPAPFGFVTAIVKSSGDYVYVSLYLDKNKKEETK